MEANWILKANRQYRLIPRLPYLLAWALLMALSLRLTLFFPHFQLFQSFLTPQIALKTFSAAEAVANGGPVFVFIFGFLKQLWGGLPLQLTLIFGLILFLRHWLHQDYNVSITRSLILFWLGQWGLVFAIANQGPIVLNLALIILYFGLLSLYVQNFFKNQRILLYFLFSLLGLQLGPVFLVFLILATLYFLRSIDFKHNPFSLLGLFIFILSLPFHIFYTVQTSALEWVKYGAAFNFPVLGIMAFLSLCTFGYYLFPALTDLWDARDEYSSKLLIGMLGLIVGMLIFMPGQLLLTVLVLAFVICLQLAKIWDEYFSNAYRLENYLALAYFVGAILGILFLILAGWCARAGWFYFNPEFFNWIMGLLLFLLGSSLVPMLVLYYARNQLIALRAQILWQWLFLVLMVTVFPQFAVQNISDRVNYKYENNPTALYNVSQYQNGQFLLTRKQWQSLDIKIQKGYQVQFETPQILLIKK